jgi:putative transposase
VKQQKLTLPNRKRLRLAGFDYSQPGHYFITICCQDMEHRFGHVIDGHMHLNVFGQIAHDEWQKLPERFPHIALGAFQIMPNHMHGIITINKLSGAGAAARAAARTAPQGRAILAVARPAIALPAIIGAYKSLTANGCLKIYKSQNQMMGKLWQRSYWERIIRNKRHYFFTARYIRNNPKNWEYRDKQNSLRRAKQRSFNFSKSRQINNLRR